MSSFGKEFDQIWPKSGTPLQLSDFGKKLLKQCENIEKPESKEVDINEFKQKSSSFPLKFGTDTCRVQSQPEDRYPFIQQQIASAYPVIHERVLQLYLDFLEHKCKYGSPVEKELYQNLNLIDLIQRLLAKRCVAFVGPHDYYKLLSGQEGVANEIYPKIGTEQEQEPFVLKHIISYDEVKLSALLYISSHSELINDGNRRNNGIIEKDLSKIEREGVVMGIIGARFQKPYFMEYQDVVITPEQNTRENGYGYGGELNNADDVKRQRLIDYRKLWQKFYDYKDFIFTKVPKDSKRFAKVLNCSFDNVLMKKRYAITFDTLLLESQARAEKVNKLAYIHIVGAGLGVWRVASHQTDIFLECFSQRVKHLLPQLGNIGVLHFSWFNTQQCGDLKHNGVFKSELHPLGGIRTFMENRNPAEKLKGPLYGNMLLVISYAWDANALPGNEFWFGSLNTSNDPSAACSTLITELHNPQINTDYVNGKNLHIASTEYGVLHISDYVKIVGTPQEQNLYKNLSLTDLVQRLLTKRCVAFGSTDDRYLLLTGEGHGNQYLDVGTAKEKEPLTLEKVLSYDEIKLSTFLSISSLTEFINDGNRLNDGVIEKDLSKIEREGIVMGLIGARFECCGLMEYQDIIISSQQNTPENGYGFGRLERKLSRFIKESHLRKSVNYRKIWQEFYEEDDLLYQDIKIDGKRFGKVDKLFAKDLNPLIFDNVMMKKRYAVIFDTLLLESQSRVKELNKQAYIHVVGIGLGVWKVSQQQTAIFLETFLQRVQYLLPQLNNIGVLHFSWFYCQEWQDLKSNGCLPSKTHPLGGIKTFLENRNPNQKLSKEFSDMLLVVTYAWDANVLPGNGFWEQSLHDSNDPSTACSTLISELHNPFINSDWVNANNLHIASPDYGLIHISDYVKNMKQ